MRFSIVTPSFNQQQWLRLCLASVADQTAGSREPAPSFSVEHLVQDGGSTDGTPRMLEAWKSRIRNRQADLPGYAFNYFSDPDRGMYDALNKGYAQASGDILAWLNCDEQYLPGTLAYVADYFRRHPGTDVLLGDALLLDSRLRPASYRRIMVPTLWHTRLDHLHSLSCAMFFRREAAPSPPLDIRWKIISDALLMDHFLRGRRRIRACGVPLSAYVVTGQNLSWTGACKQEMARWQEKTGWPPACLRSPVVALHRLRRLFHGAYLPRSVQAELYTPEQPESRRPFLARLGGLWPDPAA